MDTALVNQFLLIVLLPAWLMAGLMDWWCHRRAHIEDNAGIRESLTHLLLSAFAAAGVLPALFLEINAGVIANMTAMFIAHEITTNLDVRIATSERSLTPMEMRVHDFLTGIPFAGLLLVMATHAEQTAALFGFGDVAADFSLRWKEPALPAAYLIGWVGASFALNVLPFTEELLRGLRRTRDRG